MKVLRVVRINKYLKQILKERGFGPQAIFNHGIENLDKLNIRKNPYLFSLFKDASSAIKLKPEQFAYLKKHDIPLQSLYDATIEFIATKKDIAEIYRYIAKDVIREDF